MRRSDLVVCRVVKLVMVADPLQLLLVIPQCNEMHCVLLPLRVYGNQTTLLSNPREYP